VKRAFAFIVVFIVLGGLIGGVSYFQFIVKPQIIKTIIGGMKPPAQTVAVAQAQTDSWVRRIPAIGTFKPVQGIDVAPQVGGIVQTLHFESGQEVAKGTILIDIDASTDQADLMSGVAQMKNADLSLSRQRELISGGNTSRATVDSAQAARDVAAAAVDRAKAIIAQKTIAAPFSGRLGIRKVDIGQYVSPGTAMVTLTQLDPIYVDFPIPEQNLAALSAGQQVEVKVDGFPGETFTGAIRSIDTRFSQDSRSVVVRAEISNPDKKLLPGMFADVAVLAGAPRTVVTVPKTGVTYSLYGDSAYVVKAAAPEAAAGSAQAATPASTAPIDPNGDLVVERRFLRIGEARGDRLEVIDGLKAGDTIVTEGQIKLMPNAHVKIDPAGGLATRDPLPRQ
jgi:membrane fusion protein (multidrug efflux system)